MAFSDFKSIRSMSNEEIEQAILTVKRELLELRISKATRQNVKSHLFKHKKRLLAQLLTSYSNK
uniref:Large ribosomal subunit protein uL29c n=1 Tax=Porphyridium sordidum TaxID=28024 RepID=A0A1C9CE36_PORSO|nr:ribosomal protein L29 [Porphyridium sordidum]AOM66658.1 ribosomal protein L29 [Porphyridium sordidum]